MHEFLLMNPNHLLIQIGNYGLIHAAYIGIRYGYKQTELWIYAHPHRLAHYQSVIDRYEKKLV